MKLGITLCKLAEVIEGKLLKGNANAVFDSFITDSRKLQNNAFFWALKGSSFDAHSFLKNTLPFVKGWIIREDGVPEVLPESVITVKDTLKALQKLALWHRARFNVQVVSMTGSNGKSTTKEMLRSILSQKGKTCCNSGNFNNQLGVPLSLLELSSDDKYGVFELGASHIGDIDEIAALALPNTGIITNIAPSHLEFFGSLENIYKTKTELLKHIKPNGTIVYNADDIFLSRLHSFTGLNKLTFGKTQTCDVRILEDKSLYIKSHKTCIKPKLPYTGAHNLMNAAAATAAALSFNVAPEEIKSGLEHYCAPAMRMQEFNINGADIILDAYNANPQSMSAALREVASRRRPLVLILGDMCELGEFSEHYHRELGKNLAKIKPDFVFLAGKEMKFAEEEYKKFATCYEWAPSFEAWLPEARKMIEKGNGTFLIKASRSLHFESIIGDLTKR